ncbi:MAG: hypothetical protein WC851_00400 [Candidatus Shapirobacteria bacterium]|jgi:protein-tyrosine-phosphatase
MSAKKLIVCVCRGNILRSAIAEKLINNQLDINGLGDKYEVISRSIQGTTLDTKQVRYPNLTYYSEVYQRVKPILDELNVDLSQHVSTAINNQTATNATHIFAMDKLTKSALQTLFPDHANKILLFSDLVEHIDEVVDVPYYTKPTYSIKTIQEIKGILDKGIGNLLTLVETGNLPEKSV